MVNFHALKSSLTYIESRTVMLKNQQAESQTSLEKPPVNFRLGGKSQKPKL